MTPEPEKASQFIDKVREIVRVLRYGPRELALATLGLLLLAAGPGLKKLEWLTLPVWVFISLSVIGLLLLALAIRKVWKKVVAPLPEGKPKLPAIKGAASFGPQDADLFARLERNEELGRLRGWILDDQKPLIALMGESGVGKTSLLRAGLARALEDDGIMVIYWEALPTDPEKGLLHAVKESWADPEKGPSLATLAQAIRSRKCVVVLDQMEQLTPEQHPRIFDLLEDVALANPPHRGKWIVAFRREYAATWRDFELGLPGHVRGRIESLSLRQFSPLEAQRVVAVLAEEGGLEIDQKLMKELVDDLAVEGRVSPVDIGISLLVLSEVAKKGSSFSLDDFRSGGGQVGLLTRYLERLLGEFPEVERAELMKALLTLVDLDKDQRISEGRSVATLEQMVSPASPSRFAASLLFLSSGKARVLEQPPGQAVPGYRLVHERLIPALRRLTGLLLAEVDQARLLLDRTFRVWFRDRRRRYLLSGADLKRVLRHQGQFAWGEDIERKQAFVRKSRRWRAISRGVVSAALVALLGLAVAGTNYLEAQRVRARLESWDLPGDLYGRLAQLEELALSEGVSHLKWLSEAENLERLEVKGENPLRLDGLRTSAAMMRILLYSEIASLKGLPKGLQSLNLSGTGITSLEGLPKSLLSLDLGHGTAVTGLAELPQGLQSLSLRDPGITSLVGLPQGLQSLSLRDPRITSFVALPQGLQNLNLSSTVIPSLEGLPKGLQSLNLSDSRITSLAGLPQGLQSLNLSGSVIPSLEGLPKGLQSLNLSGTQITSLAGRPQGLEGLPNGLQSLNLSGIRITSLASLPQGLQSLDLSTTGITSLAGLPRDLQSLNLSGTRITSLAGLPQGLQSLDLSTTRITSLAGLPQGLQSLDLSGTGITSLEGLPQGLQSLSLSGTRITNLAGLPQGLQSLDLSGAWISNLAVLPQGLQSLDLSDTHITRLAVLPQGLQSLDLSDTGVTSLKDLPPRLRRLVLSSRQIKTLAGLPRSVTSLHFR